MYHENGKIANGIINHIFFHGGKLYLGGFRQMNSFLFFKKNLKTLGFIGENTRELIFLNPLKFQAKF